VPILSAPVTAPFSALLAPLTPFRSWSGSLAAPAGFTAPLPPAPTLQIPVANSGAPGSWMVAFCGWKSPAGLAPTVGVGDDAHNKWDPVGTPAGTAASTSGLAGASIWATANPRQAGNVYVSPNGLTPSLAALVAEFTGLSPWQTLAGIVTGLASGATSLPAMALGQSPAGTPLNANPSFAAGVTPWTGLGNAALAAVSCWGYQADFSLQITPDGVTASPGASSEKTVPVTAGQPCTASSWAVSPQGWPSVQAGITWYSSGGSPISSATAAAVPADAGEALFLTVSGTAPAAAVAAAMTVVMTGTPAASTLLYVSDAIIGVPAQALLLTLLASDSTAALISGPGSGWNALPPVVSSNGTDHAADCVITPAWQLASAGATASYSASVAADLAGVAAAVLVQGIAPVAPNPNWPLVQAQAAFGSGATTPWDQQSWWGMTSRFRGMNTGRGKQYELDSIQAGQGNWTLANNDGNLTPEYAAGLYYPSVRVYTPVRLLVTWPPPPAANSRTYPVTRTFMERWPKALTSARYQVTNAVSADVWSVLTTQLKTLPRAEVLQEPGLFAYWPLDDPAGSVSGANLAPTAAGPIQVAVSKYGPAGAVSAFGVSAPYLAGDGSASSWQQSGLTAALNGYSLYYQDSNLPPVPGGVTAEGWFNVSTAAPAQGQRLISVVNSKAILIAVLLVMATGQMQVVTVDKTTGTTTYTTVSTVDWQSGSWFHVALEFTQTTWRIYVNAGSAVVASGTCNLAATPYWLSFCGQADRQATGTFLDGQVAHCAVYAGTLTQSRLVTHYLSMLTGLYGDDLTGQRIDRLLSAGNCAFPRCIPPGIDTVVGATDVAGQAVGQNLVNIAESDSSLLMVDGPGYLFVLGRQAGWDLPVSWTFGGLVAAQLNANSGFESGVSPWTAQNSAALSQSALCSYGGQNSALFTGSGTTAVPGIASESIPVIPGDSYTTGPWLYSPQGWASGVTVTISWYTSGGSLISSSPSATTALTAGLPAEITAAGQAPAAADHAIVTIAAAGTPASSVQFFADAAAFTASATEQPFLADIATDYDPTQIFNDLTMTQLAGPKVIGGAAAGVTVALTNPTSMGQYGDLTLQQTVYLSDPAVIMDTAQWIANQYGDPATRIAQLTLDPSANPALWPVVLSLESGQVAFLNLRLAGTQLEITGQFQIMTLSHNTQPGSWRTVVSLVRYLGNVLTADDTVRGLLNGTNPLGY